MSDDAKSILRDQEHLASLRMNWDSYWQEIAYRVLPSSSSFTTIDQEGNRRNERAFDTTPITANERFAAFIGEGLCPRDQIWHKLGPEDDELQEHQPTRVYLDRLNKALFRARYKASANFVSQRQENFLSLGAFGNYATYIDEVVGEGLRYRAIYLGELFWAENHQGRIDLLHRKYPMQARQALKFFGKLTPPKIVDAAEKNPFQLFDIIHCVRENDEFRSGRSDYRGMKWASYYICCDSKSVISRGGYWSWPYAIGRFMKAPRETYARSPAVSAFPAILTVNEQKKTVLRAGQKAVDPPVLLEDDGALEAFNMRAGALNYGYLKSDGVQLAQPWNNQARVELGVELMALEQRAINDAFMVSLFQILAEKPNMTAAEVYARMGEKAELLSPATGRLEAEDLGPQIEREIDLMSRDSQYAWISDEMPDELRERGGDYKPLYDGPLSRARRAGDALAITRTMEVQTIAIGIDPRAKHVLKVPEAMREIAEINGVPAKLINTMEEIDELSGQEAEQQQLAAAAQLAPGVAGAAKDIAQAEQLRQAGTG
jgi:hypothetical protein